MFYYIPSVIRVTPKEDYHVEVMFDNGKVVDYDASELLEEEECRALQSIDVFMKTCKVLGGTLAWDLTGANDPNDCIDVDPTMLYECRALNDSLFFMGLGVMD